MYSSCSTSRAHILTLPIDTGVVVIARPLVGSVMCVVAPAPAMGSPLESEVFCVWKGLENLELRGSE